MIRAATSKDIPAMMALFRKHHAAMGCDWSINEPRLVNTFAVAIATPTQWLCLTGGDCLLLATWFESPVGAGRLAMEFCFCAPPSKRDELIEQYEQWSRGNGCSKSSLSITRRFEAFMRLFRRRGYAPDEMTLSKVL